MTYVYALCDELDRIRYIGKTVKTAEKRLAVHLNEAKNGIQNRRCNWLRSLLVRGIKPKIKILEQGHFLDGCLAEKHWIERLRKSGLDLVNGTDGGDGIPGHRHTEASRKQMSLAALGRIISESQRQKISQANSGNKYNVGRIHTLDARRRMGESRRGTHRTLAQREHLSVALKNSKALHIHLHRIHIARKGTHLSEETKQKISSVKRRNNANKNSEMCHVDTVTVKAA